MECCGIRGLTSQWFQSYLKERRQLTVVQAIKFDNNSINHGVPQGSLLWYLLLIFTIQLNIVPYITLQMIQTYVSEKNHSKKIIKYINRDLLLTADWIRLKKLSFNVSIQKQPSRGVLRKGCYENMQQIYRRTLMPKCNFNKVALHFF